MKNFVKIFAAISLATAVSFAQDDYQDDESPWGNTEEEAQEESAQNDQDSQEDQAKATAPAFEEEDDAYKNVNIKRNGNAARNVEQAKMASASRLDNENDYVEAERKSINDDEPITHKAGFGIHAAFNYNKLYGLAQDWDLGEDEDAPAGIGFEVGLAGRFPLLPVMQFTPEVLFSMGKLQQEDEAFKRNFRQMDLLIPLMIRVTPIEKIYLGAGAQLGFNLSNKTSIDGEVDLGGGLGTTYHTMKENIKQSSFNMGLLFAVGGYIVKGWSIDARIYLGLNNMYPDFKKDDADNVEYSKLINLFDAKMMSFKIGMGYWFI